ncbi:MAG: hypothetical protein COX39_02475 [Candidatus Nealsonbacteria bacterium CG23_combo_of_CG06-09_8_20_14_all_40_13]|uniref:Uncharacterized protein n=1 Tax=Candidatus Nealsonbacteria bacterium CG23_combo_of_CG06-09_8_20_14_all_40_13 TaxID=1974724 RepID=A0A2G9YQL5_9BACT|nr:MAG: hypothetical protein COX39_02475 [Candidatus Nealsonbacteria bacterium CG23_combo_of_CG06-09_8_20_14_all_40_13]PIR71072.1 MAG: hypothetical protein COU44_01525 [Candidatus Nealsonbacteria bacterium CG10_big_fil_rev_8_21_14_0_10_40_24]PIU43304.1 MAG: hypothetical protein COS97_01705 [Candidatus Nealsonbacteria bacterium CG07_land_8_20_14_0_80_40_10]
MSKKKKKFKRDVRSEVLKQIAQSQPSAPKQVIQQPVKTVQNKPATFPAPAKVEMPAPLIGDRALIAKDLRKTAYIMGLIIAILITASILSYKTTILLELSAKVFHWLHLG